MLTTARVLPGITFTVEPPPQVRLPRMDVAAFVGFAARGPVHTPVPVEDIAQFRAIFGDALILAWDTGTGAAQTTRLAPAVRDFFAQGGRRCWAVRVAGAAEYGRFPVPGLLNVGATGYVPATLRARSAGSWSDRLSVGASLLVEPLGFEAVTLAAGARFAGRLSSAQGSPLQPGDVIQLDARDGVTRGYVAVETAAGAEPPLGQTGTWQRVEGSVFWFQDATTLSAEGLAHALPYGGAPPDAWPARLAFPDLYRTDGLPPPLAEMGDWLVFEPTGGARVWLLVDSSGEERVVIRGAWREGASGTLMIAQAARVALALYTQEEDRQRAALLDLALAAPHVRFWGSLPDDQTYYQREPSGALPPDQPLATAPPDFPLAGPADGTVLSLPLGLDLAPFVMRGPLAATGLPLQRDGLTPAGVDPYALTGADWAEFLQEVYLDPVLRYAGELSLLADAFDRCYVQEQALLGIHSLIHIDEISLLALPDAAQRGWRRVEPARAPAPEPPPEPEPLEACPGHDVFKPCCGASAPPERPEPPKLDNVTLPLAEEAAWSLLAEEEYDAAGLLNLHVKATELASARADVVAILGMPWHYRLRQALDYRQTLGTTLLRNREATPSYAALYHPGLVVRETEGSLRLGGPEGAACGIIATRSRERGAWVAPANMPIRGALALAPTFTPSELEALYLAGVNPIRPEARGFVVWGAHTLSDDPDLGVLNVRRLLILLRRIALRDGQGLVFAPHSPAFRRQLALQLERLLATLFERGAFAGMDPTQAFRVVIDETVNPPASVEQGRLVVELRVAPSQPLVFITVKLVETRAGTLVVQEG